MPIQLLRLFFKVKVKNIFMSIKFDTTPPPLIVWLVHTTFTFAVTSVRRAGDKMISTIINFYTIWIDVTAYRTAEINVTVKVNLCYSLKLRKLLTKR